MSDTLDFRQLEAFVAVVASGCDIRAPGRPAPDSQVPRPDKVTSFAVLGFAFLGVVCYRRKRVSRFGIGL